MSNNEAPEPDYDDEADEFDEAAGNCCLHPDNGIWSCGAAGSEWCDWDCPFSGDIGTSVDE